jgi:hypothetical protein
LLSIAPVAYGEDAGKSWFRQRVAVGGRLSVAGNALLGADPFLFATSNPALRVSRTTEFTSGRVGAGAALQIRVSNRFGIGVDLVYRRAGYVANEERIQGVDLTTTSNYNEQKTIWTTDTTRAQYFELPVFARLYFGHRQRADFRRFFDCGMAIRRVGRIRTIRDVVGPDDETSTEILTSTPANRTVLGWVAGAGIQVTDEFGIHIAPGVRYSHWMSDTLASVRSNRHQVEFTVGITF